MKIITKTQRLIIREMELEDAPFMFDLNSDYEVVKYTGDVAFENLEQAKNIIQYVRNQYENFGMGRWVVSLQDDNNTMLGWCGLKFDTEINEVDLGYRYMQKYWGKGYAYEAALACVQLGFQEMDIQKMIGRAMKENIASIRVLEKCGFRYLRDNECGEEPGVWYELYKND